MTRLPIVIISLASIGVLPGALSLTIDKAGSDGITLSIHGDGLVSGSISPGDTLHYLVFGTTDDSFLSDNELGKNDLISAPTIALDGFESSQHLYRDNEGGFGLHSYLEFEFQTSGLSVINLDLATLSGTYLLDNWQLSDFNQGVYPLTTATPSLPIIFSGSGLDEITLTVVPEPSTALLSFLAIGFFLRSRSRQQKRLPFYPGCDSSLKAGIITPLTD